LVCRCLHKRKATFYVYIICSLTEALAIRTISTRCSSRAGFSRCGYPICITLVSQERKKQSAWFQLQRTYHHALCATSTEPAGAVKVTLPGKVPSMSSSMPLGFCMCELGMNMVPPLSCLNSSRQISTCALDWHHAACWQLIGVGPTEHWSNRLHY